jgi:hypothetical protein
MTRYTVTKTIQFQRNLDKVDRRLQKPHLTEEHKDALRAHREALFSGEVDTAELDHCLRAIDKDYRQRLRRYGL